MRTGKPTRIDRMLEKLFEQKKWRQGIRAARLRLSWEEVVGPQVAAHTKPEHLSRGRLYVSCDHDVWRTELAYLKPELLKRIAEAVGEGVVKEIFLR
ncbi:DUF721 domain-containing protein [bacterium]|nr:DUF721 domain-containing protein [bacterium]MBU1983454.1 DUF721 domain-containing protein [bacterium]